MKWSPVLSILIAASCALDVTACDYGGDAPTATERATADRIVNVWQVIFETDAGSATLRSDRIEPMALGEIAFVSNAGYPGRPGSDPANYGTYAIDFKPLGFSLDRESIPVAIAWPLPGDSAEIVLGAPRGNRVVIRVSVTDGALRGRWYLRLPRAAGVSGAFSALPRAESQR